LSFPPIPVRIRASFGHLFEFSTYSCPNQGLIRTPFWVSHLFLSESGANSDTFLGFPPIPVRIRASFGHLFEFSTYSCPNQGLIRTPFWVFHLFLSESGPHSDTFLGFPPIPVRIRAPFGHLFGFFSYSCPNQGLIRTPFWVFHLFLSESGLNSDTFLGFHLFLSESGLNSDTVQGFPPIPVQIWGSSGHCLGFLILKTKKTPNQWLRVFVIEELTF
jgi:hypothetical protein